MAKRELRDSIGFPFTPIPHGFITFKKEDGSTHSHIAFRLFVCLRHFTSIHTNDAFPSYDTLRELTGMTLNSIGKALRELEKSGWLSKKKRFGRSTIYTLLTPESPTENHNPETPISSTESRSDSPTEKRRPVLRLSVEKLEPCELEPLNKTQIVAASPQSAKPATLKGTRSPCPNCKASVNILESGGVPVAICLTCGIDALLPAPPDLSGDSAKCVEYFKHRFHDRFNEWPRVTKGKDFGIIRGLVADYGKARVQELLRMFVLSDDDHVKSAGYSIAFFSTRINPLLVATAGKFQSLGCAICSSDPMRERLKLPAGMVHRNGEIISCVCRKSNGKTDRQIQAPAMR